MRWNMITWIILSAQLLTAQSDQDFKNIISQLNREAGAKKISSPFTTVLNQEDASKKSLKYYLRNQEGEIVGKLSHLDEDGKPVYFKTLNEDAAITTNTASLNSGGSNGLGLTGKGLTVLLDDAGAPRLDHVMFNDSDNNNRLINHGVYEALHPTWVAGIIGGNESLGTELKGMAPEVNIETVLGHGEEQYGSTLISNHSVIRTNGTYHYFFDDLTYNNPYHLEVVAAGNGGNGSLALANCSKNELTVGNVGDVLSYRNASDVDYKNSCVGPSVDGRIKPDIVGNGFAVKSASSVNSKATITSTGTSGSCANVSGSLILVQEYFYRKHETFMRSSTLKALAIHTAREAGSHPGPDYTHGYGLLNTRAMIDHIDENRDNDKIKEASLQSGETHEFLVYPEVDRPLVLTLAWTDPSGGHIIFPYGPNLVDTSIHALVNDLDIRVEAAGHSYYPYTLDRMNPCAPARQKVNHVDNVEQIEIPSPYDTETPFRIIISHKGGLVNGKQDYALILSGVSDKQPSSKIGNIEIEADQKVSWTKPKELEQEGHIVVSGLLKVGAMLSSTYGGKISVLPGASLILSSAILRNVDIYFHEGSSFEIIGNTQVFYSSMDIVQNVDISIADGASVFAFTPDSQFSLFGVDSELASHIHGFGEVSNLPPAGSLQPEFLLDGEISGNMEILYVQSVKIGSRSTEKMIIPKGVEVKIIAQEVRVYNQGIEVEEGGVLWIEKTEQPMEVVFPDAVEPPIYYSYFQNAIYETPTCAATASIPYNP